MKNEGEESPSYQNRPARMTGSLPSAKSPRLLEQGTIVEFPRFELSKCVAGECRSLESRANACYVPIGASFPTERIEPLAALSIRSSLTFLWQRPIP